jgi:dephospho-CoA kinase
MAASIRALLGGGIGSGKSTASALFSSFGAEVFSADAATHAVLEPDGAAFPAVAARWPTAVVAGRIDRKALAAIVFSNPLAREALERITHPAIGRLLAERVAPIARGVVLVEMPLPKDLLGPGWRWVVVDAPDEVRLARLVERGMTAEEAGKRMAAQPSREEWLAKADLVVDNAAGPDHLSEECRRAWQAMQAWVGGDAAGNGP